MEDIITEFHKKDINQLIEEYMPLIIKTVSSITGRYVNIKCDDEFSIALLAFKEAFEKYESSRGSFSSYAKLVITSRVKSYLISEAKHNKTCSLEELIEAGIDFQDTYQSSEVNNDELIGEINNLKENIKNFGFTFEDLVEEAPKHEDTRNRAIELSERVSKEIILTTFMYEKKRLPVKQISIKFTVTEKIIKRSKKFIISVVIIFDKNYRNLKLWIKR